MSRASKFADMIEKIIGFAKESGVELTPEQEIQLAIMQGLKDSKKDHAPVIIKINSLEEAKEVFKRLEYTPKSLNGLSYTQEDFLVLEKLPTIIGNPFLDDRFVTGEYVKEMQKIYTVLEVKDLPEKITKEHGMGRTRKTPPMDQLKELLGFLGLMEEGECSGCPHCGEEEQKYFVTAINSKTGIYFNKFVKINADLDEASAMESFYKKFLENNPDAVITYIKELI